jgi:mono/diheme cytochrome c family protein
MALVAVPFTSLRAKIVMRRTLCVSTIFSLLAACAHAPPPPAQLSDQSGAQLYQTLCASCHGPSAHGDGPVAPLIKTPMSDLTRLALRDGGEFPTEDVRRTIDGRLEQRAHGPRDMPVWGKQLYFSAANDDAAARRTAETLIDRLVTYLRSIQQPSS